MCSLYLISSWQMANAFFPYSICFLCYMTDLNTASHVKAAILGADYWSQVGGGNKICSIYHRTKVVAIMFSSHNYYISPRK